MNEENATGVAAATIDRAGGASRGRIIRVLQIEWIGQTLASLCWIVSVFAYGISSAGDWLQLAAASAWLVANIAAAAVGEEG